MKTLTAKSRLTEDSFFYDAVVKIGRNTVVPGTVDGKRVYFLELRTYCGEMHTSITFTSLAAVRKALPNKRY